MPYMKHMDKPCCFECQETCPNKIYYQSCASSIFPRCLQIASQFGHIRISTSSGSTLRFGGSRLSVRTGHANRKYLLPEKSTFPTLRVRGDPLIFVCIYRVVTLHNKSNLTELAPVVMPVCCTASARRPSFRIFLETFPAVNVWLYGI